MQGRALALALSLLAIPAAAQVPFGHFVVSVTGTNRESSAYFVDPRTGDLTPVRNLPQGLLSDLRLVAEEPTSGSILTSTNVIALNATILTRFPLAGRVAGPSAKITWTQPRGSAVRDARVITRGVLLVMPTTGLWLGPLAGGTATQLGTVANAEAVTADTQYAYVLTRTAGNPSTIWRYDFTNNSFAQVVGNLPESRSIDLFPASPRLLVGTQAGDLYIADAASGQSLLLRNVSTSPIVALRYAPSGDLLVADQPGRLYTLSSIPNPIATLPGTPVDMDAGTNPVASFFTFGESCAGSGGFEPEMGSNGLPSLGNAAFGFTVAKALGGSAAVFALGNSRRAWGPVTLPFALQGAPGCAVRVNGVVTAGLALAGGGAGNGTASFGLPIPNQSALTGVTLVSQWWCLDAGGNTLGLTTSEGGEAIVR
jgi:hypothetical protein